MFIVEERPWDASPNQADDLREKLITLGRMATRYLM
jgi:hypothetical protein